MKPSFRAIRRALCLSLCLLALPAAWAGQIKYPGMVVFGDSLSDTGNDFLLTSAIPLAPAIPPSSPGYATYWQGRFTNGPVAVEYLWRLVSRQNHAEVAPSETDRLLQTKAALSFAHGGSTSGDTTLTPMGFPVPGLLGQVAQFTHALGKNRKASDKALYVVWSGSNDYLQQATDGPARVVGNVETAIRRLYGAGARDFLVPNLANLGVTPFVQQQNQGPLFTQLSKTHNALLKTMLARLERELRSIRIVEVDVFKLGEAVLSTGLVSADVPAVEYLKPGIGASMCLFINPATCQDVPQQGFMPPFMFWDAMHPTTQVHGVLGTAMFGALLLQR